jgi:radical SAM-linked protein
MVNIFLRAMRRARIPLAYSGGFHPMPKVSFEDPLPLGMESMKERFFATVGKEWDESELVSTLNGMLPEGLRIAQCDRIESRKKVEKDRFSLYMAILREGTFSREKLGQFESRSEWIFVKTGKKGKTRNIDLKKVVDRIEIVGENRVLLKIGAEPGKIARPSDILEHVFDMDDKAIKGARVIKLDGRKDADVQATGDQRL